MSNAFDQTSESLTSICSKLSGKRPFVRLQFCGFFISSFCELLYNHPISESFRLSLIHVLCFTKDHIYVNVNNYMQFIIYLIIFCSDFISQWRWNRTRRSYFRVLLSCEGIPAPSDFHLARPTMDGTPELLFQPDPHSSSFKQKSSVKVISIFQIFIEILNYIFLAHDYYMYIYLNCYIVGNVKVIS